MNKPTLIQEREGERERERDSKLNTIKDNSIPREQNKKLSQYSKKIVAKNSAEAFKIIKWWTRKC